MKDKPSLRWGLTLVLAAGAVLIFYNTVFQNSVLITFFGKLIGILNPVIFGLAFAYLLAPIVNFSDRHLKRFLHGKAARLVRGLSILFTWLVVGVFVYLFSKLLFPQLYTSIKTLISNLGSYYETVFGWVSHLVDSNPEIAAWVNKTMSSYYKDLTSLIYDEWIPRAQVALTYVTGGIVSVVIFLKNILIGVCISVYMLARKETFLAHARKLLYSMVRRERYERLISFGRAADSIFSGFVRGKLLDSLIIGILCLIWCTLVKMPYTPLVSVIVGVTNMIPFFGPLLGAVPSALLILLVDSRKCLYFLLFIFLLQQFDGNVLGPKILGRSVGVSGFWIIVAILIGGGFFGVMGMFLGVPVLTCILYAVKLACDRSLARKGVTDDSVFYQNSPPPQEAAETQGDRHV